MNPQKQSVGTNLMVFGCLLTLLPVVVAFLVVFVFALLSVLGLA